MATQSLRKPQARTREASDAAFRYRRFTIWFMVVFLSLAFCSFFPFPLEVDVYAKSGPKPVGGFAFTALGYFRYLMLLASVGFLVIYFVQNNLFTRQREMIIETLRRYIWLPCWIILLISSFFISPAARDRPMEVFVAIFTIPAAMFLNIYLGRANTIVRTVYVALALCLAVSFLGVAFLPDRATHLGGDHTLTLNENLAGLWRGIFAHKNIAGGYFMELGVLALTFLFGLRGGKKLNAVILLGSVIFVIFSGSESSVVAPVAALFVFTLIRMSRWIGYAVAETLPPLYIAFPFIVVKYLSPLGISLDSRDRIWEVAINYNRGHWLFGHGYLNGFGGEAISSQVFDRWMLDIGHAHSGVMDTYIYFGVVGLACLWLMVRSVVRAYTELMHQSDRTGDRVFHSAALLTFLCALVRSMSEPDILTPRGGWLVMLLMIFVPVVELTRQRNLKAAARSIAPVQPALASA